MVRGAIAQVAMEVVFGGGGALRRMRHLVRIAAVRRDSGEYKFKWLVSLRVSKFRLLLPRRTGLSIE